MLSPLQPEPSAIEEPSLAADAVSQLLKAAADVLRLQILRALSADSFGVLELCSLFDIKQSSMSHHLKVMARAQLVSTRREGNTIFYRRSFAQLPEQLSNLRDSIFLAADQQSKDKKAVKTCFWTRKKFAVQYAHIAPAPSI